MSLDTAIKAIVDEISLARNAQLLASIEDLKKKVKQARIQEHVIVLQGEREISKIEGIQHSQYETVLKLINSNLNVMLVGPAGSGKNHLAENVAKSLQLDFYPEQKVSQEFSLTGFIDASGNYKETTFYKCFKDGGVFFLDEMDASSPEALIILNAAIANRYFNFPIGKVSAHQDFRVIAGANTLGNGADSTYTSRNSIDGATLDRFEVINIDYDSRVELIMAGGNEDIIDCVKTTRLVFKKAGVDKIISPRTSQSIYKMMEWAKFDLKNAWTIRVWNKLDEDEKNLVRNNQHGKELLNELNIK